MTVLSLQHPVVKVEVYSGSFKMATYYMPNKEGTLWHVCDYDSRTKALTNVNEVTYHTESSKCRIIR